MSGVGRAAAFFAAAFLITASGAGSAVAEVKPGSESGASVAQSGWWWKANDSESPLEPVPKEKPPTVPDGALPVQAVNGEPEMLSAIDFTLEAGAGADVSSFTVVARETESPGANANAANAVIVACPITVPWWDAGEAASWSEVPKHDCDNGAKGERSEEGVWTFELTGVAAGWLSPQNESAHGIVLAPQVESPESFQVTFDGPSADGVGAELMATGGTSGGTGSGMASGTGESGTIGGDSVPGDAGSPGASLPGGGEGSAMPSGEAPDAAPAAGGGNGGEGATPPPDPQLAAAPQATGLESVFQSLPGGLWVLIPLAIGIGYAIMLALGPAGEPGAAQRRRGVSRALDRWRSAKSATGGTA